MFNHKAFSSSVQLVLMCLSMPSRSNWNLEVLVFEQRERPKNLEKKTLRAEERTNKQTQPKYRAILVAGKASALITAQPLKIKHNNSTS